MMLALVVMMMMINKNTRLGPSKLNQRDPDANPGAGAPNSDRDRETSDRAPQAIKQSATDERLGCSKLID